MTSKKKSFLLHVDSLDILDDLTDEQAGMLFKTIKSFQNNEEYKIDNLIKMVFIPFKNQFIRDNEKYAKTCERRAIAGSKGGKQKVANASKCKQTLANVADSVNDSDSDSDSDSDNKKKEHIRDSSESPAQNDLNSKTPYAEIVEIYHEVLPNLPKVVKLSPKRKKAIKARHTGDLNQKTGQWRKYFEKIRTISWMVGGNDRNWIANFDYLIKQDTMIGVAEGTKNDR